MILLSTKFNPFIYLLPDSRKRVVNGYDQTDYGERITQSKVSREYAEGPRQSRQTKKELTEVEIRKLIENAPPGSVKQSINVEREEEEIIGPLPLNQDGSAAEGPDGLLNFDTISEKVDLGVAEGKAQLAVKVRCERVVPIRGVEDMFKKSSVIVTRLIEVDLQVTEERRQLLGSIMRASHRPAIEAGPSRGGRSYQQGGQLSTKDTFKLYKAFMGMAEAEDNRTKQTMIEKKLEDERNLPEQAEFNFPTEGIQENEPFGDEIQMEYDTEALESKIENQIITDSSGGAMLEALPDGRGHLMKTPDPDTISYMSVASEQSDILY